MCRAIFPYELGDPDFAWLLATFQESHPSFVLVDSTCLPLTLVAMGPDHPVEVAEKPAATITDMQDLARETAEK